MYQIFTKIQMCQIHRVPFIHSFYNSIKKSNQVSPAQFVLYKALVLIIVFLSVSLGG